MSLTEANWKQALLWDAAGALQGAPAQEPDTTDLMEAVEAQIDTLWEMAGVFASNIAIRYQYGRRIVFDLLLGQLRTRRDGNLGPLVIRDQALFDNLQQLRQAAQTEIERLEKLARAGIMPASGLIIHQRPRQVTVDRTRQGVSSEGEKVLETEYNPGPFGPNPNDPHYGGSPIDRPDRRPPDGYQP